jgi:hypothetical protein
MSALDILECGRQLIDSEDKWCQNDAMQDKDGNTLISSYDRIEKFKELESIEGCRYCTYGALKAAGMLLDVHRPQEWDAERYMLYALNDMRTSNRGYIDFNDNPETKYSDVIALWDLAIQKCKDAGK